MISTLSGTFKKQPWKGTETDAPPLHLVCHSFFPFVKELFFDVAHSDGKYLQCKIYINILISGKKLRVEIEVSWEDGFLDALKTDVILDVIHSDGICFLTGHVFTEDVFRRDTL